MVKRRGQKYSDVDKAAAVEMYLSGPESYEKTAWALGLKVRTLARWVADYRRKHPEDTR